LLVFALWRRCWSSSFDYAIIIALTSKKNKASQYISAIQIVAVERLLAGQLHLPAATLWQPCRRLFHRAISTLSYYLAMLVAIALACVFK